MFFGNDITGFDTKVRKYAPCKSAVSSGVKMVLQRSRALPVGFNRMLGGIRGHGTDQSYDSRQISLEVPKRSRNLVADPRDLVHIARSPLRVIGRIPMRPFE